MTPRRGSFTAATANEWMQSVLDRWVATGNSLRDLLVVCDNAPCHSRLHLLFDDSPALLLKLGPYSPMLNPVEAIWAKVKAHVKSAVRVPVINPPGVTEQRIVYLERCIDDAVETIRNSDCSRCVQHSTSFHSDVLQMRDMRPGV